MMIAIAIKMALFWEAFSDKRFVCCALTVLYSIVYNTVGRSIGSLNDYDGIFSLGRIYRL